MNRKLRGIALALLVLGLPCAVSAHRLDEYLQATRISIEQDRVVAEIYLTPGAAVANDVFATIDRDRNAYLRDVVESLSLEIDGQRHSLILDGYSMPLLGDMQRGEGVIRLRTSAAIAHVTSGRHHLHFANAHRPDIGVYLVNALVPADERIRIKGMSRDMLQREFDLDYSIAASEGLDLAGVWPSILGLAMAAAIYVLAQVRGR